MENKCESIQESLLIRFFAGETDTTENERIIEWINSSEESYQAAKEVYYIYYATKLHQIKKEIDVDVVFNTIEKTIRKGRFKQKKTQFIKIFQQVAAVLLLPVLMLTGYLWTQGQQSDMHYIELTAKQGMVAKAVLPDSTVVYLNSGSSLKYPSVFLSGERKVELVGEAYFDVRKDEKKRFSVYTPENLSINVLGTKFNVQAYSGDDKITATLIEGKVNVVCRDEQGNRRQTELNPSQRLVYDLNNRKSEVKKVSVAQYIAWKDGKIIFEDTNLKDVLSMLSRHFNVDFTVKNPSFYSNSYTGKFEGERLEEILMLIHKSSNIRYELKQQDPWNDKRIIELY